MAGVGPEDLNVIEVHDASAPAELVIYEELGLCKPGEGGKLIDSKATYFDGPIPVNPSGGLISKGHPIGATGVAQIYEIFTQLRGEAGDRQVTQPEGRADRERRRHGEGRGRGAGGPHPVGVEAKQPALVGALKPAPDA